MANEANVSGPSSGSSTRRAGAAGGCGMRIKVVIDSKSGESRQKIVGANIRQEIVLEIGIIPQQLADRL